MPASVLSLPGCLPCVSTGKVLSPAAMEINKRYLLNNVKLSIPEDKLVHSLFRGKLFGLVHHVEPV